MANSYLTSPAMKIAERQVNRPTETTAIWFSLPCCHTSLAFSTAISGSSSSRPCQTFTLSLLVFLGMDSLWGFGGMTPPLNVCRPLEEACWSANPQKDVATRKAQIRKARARSSMTPIGEDTEQELCRRENMFSVWTLIFPHTKTKYNMLYY